MPSAQPHTPPSFLRRAALFAGLWTAVFALDRMVKLWAENTLRGLGPQRVLPFFLELRYSQNRGMALGLLSGNVLATLLLPLIALFIWFMVFRKYRATLFTTAASALMLGGFAGNFLDRLLFRYVVDMIYFPFLPWFICNLADIGICAGVGLMGISLLFRPQDWREKHEQENGDSGQ